MTVSSAHAAIGTQLQMDDGGGTFTTIAEVTEISGPELSADTTDVTHHQSNGDYEEALPTILRTGEVSFTISYLPTDSTHDATAGLLSVYEGKTKRDYKLIFPDGSSTTWTIPAYVTGFSPSEPVDDRLSAEVTLKPTGQPTLA